LFFTINILIKEILVYCSLQHTPLEGSCVVVAIIENYRTSKPSRVSPEKSQILSCDIVVANERYVPPHETFCAFLIPSIPESSPQSTLKLIATSRIYKLFST
jgi:hypothetical protein